MRRITTLLSLVLALVVGGSSVALGWHVTTGEDQQTLTVISPKVKAFERGPAGDPFHRIVVKVSPSKATYGACTGWVEVPDERWAKGTTLYVEGTDVAIGPGERATLPEGSYRGTWSNSREVEKFDISCKPAPSLPSKTVVNVKWVFTGRDGRVVRRVLVPEGCTFRSGWNYHRGNTPGRVKADGKVILRYRAAPPGFYKPLWKGFTPGVSCPA